MNASELVQAARGYLGTPWVHQARVKGVGVDCVGLLVCAAADAGLYFEDVTDYPARAYNDWMLQELDRQLIRAGHYPSAAAQVIAFGWHGNPWHVALVTQLEPLRIIHAYKTAGQVVETGLRTRILSAWNIPGVS